MKKVCVVCGNGPSLKDMPIDEWIYPLYGVNWCPLFPDYYVCMDSHILLEHPSEIESQVFLSDIAYLPAKHKDDEPCKALYSCPNVKLVDTDTRAFAKEEFVSGFNVIYVCLKLAYYAGFDEVHLWGVDHTKEWEHYSPDYHPLTSNPERHLHNMKVMEKHFRLARKVYDLAGKRILNFSRESSLDNIFERGVR